MTRHPRQAAARLARMSRVTARTFSLLLALVLAVAPRAQATQAIERSIPSMPKSCWFVLPARDGKVGKPGRPAGLVVLLPGGNGSRDFLPFVENGLCAQLPDDCIGALVTSVKWRPEQEIVWPTATNKVPDMAWTTEQHVRAVVAELEREHTIDPARRCVVAWSSSGPAMYPLLAAADGPFSRAYLAMSIWPRDLRELGAVKGRRYVLDQSPDDEVTTFAHARAAFEALTKAQAVVRVSTYAGGHGWLDNPLPRFRDGMAWLLSDAPAPVPKWPDGKVGKAATKPGKQPVGKNLLANGGFEKGREQWNLIDKSGTVKAEPDKKVKVEGKQSLHLSKPAAGAMDLLTQEVDLAAGTTVSVALRLKSQGATNAWVKLWLYDAADKPVHEAVDVTHVTADADWQSFEKTWPRQAAVRAVLQVILVSGGELWLDDVVLKVAD